MDRSNSLMDQVFAAVTLPPVGQNTIVEHREESHAVYHSESHHEQSHHEHVEYTTSGVTVGNVIGGHDAHRRPTIDNEDQRSEVSAISKATSVSVHSSVSQKSAQQYDLPPIPQYDLPPTVTVGDVVGKAPSVASSGSHHSAASRHSRHSHHSHHSVHSAHTHDSESTITEGTLVNEPIVVGGVVRTGSEVPTPLAVGQSFEHDAVIEQFKNLHGKEPSVVSSIVPTSIHLQSDSEDSIAPSKLTHSIQVDGVFGSHNGIDVLHRSHDLSYTDLIAPEYYQPPSVQNGFDARSEDSFGFEKVEYVEQRYEPEPVKQVVHEHVIEQQTYEPYHIVHENHNVPSVDFEEERHSTHEHHHHHDHSHVTHTFTTDVKQSRSNSASTYQSRHMLAHNVGPKITEELRPAVVLEEDETHVEPPVMAYVAPIPVKPPRTHEESHVYNAYESDDQHHHHYHHVEVVKSTTITQEDVRSGSQGVSALRAKFERGAPPPLAPVLEFKKHEAHQHNHHHQHENAVEHVQVGQHFTTVENHYDVPFESREKSSSSSSCSSSSSSCSSSSSSSSSVVSSQQVVYDTPAIENLSHLPVYQEQRQQSVSSSSHLYETPVDNYPHSPAFYKDDQHHHYVPQIKVITEYRHINPRHHYVETRVKKADEVAQSPQVQSIDYFKEIDRVHHFVPSTPTSPTKEVRNTFHHHNYVPNSLEAKRESRSVERVHHYLPENPTTVVEDRKIIREHNYVPLEKRSQSVETTVNHHHNYVPLVAKEEHHHHHVNRDHQYVPVEMKQEVVKSNVNHDHHYVPFVQKISEETVQVVREHNYLPLHVEKVQKTENVDWHNQYVPLTGSKTEVKTFDVGRSHSYIPLGENIEVSKPVILREHNYVPLVEKKVEHTGAINHQQHNYLPAHSHVAVSDNVVISREHSFVPLANKVDEAPRHSNNLSHHHYVPLPTKRSEATTATGDKVGHEHHYFPLAPKTEQASVHTGQQHHFVPLVSKASGHDASTVTHQHQYIPLTMKQDGMPRLPREHNYIPLAAHIDSHEKVDLEHHQYLPPVTHAEKKGAVKLYEHQYVPLPPKQESHVVRKIEGKEHHYVPLVQNYATERPPQLPREHHYFPLAVREEQHQKAAHDHHNYIPAVQRQQNHQPQDRHHGYVPLPKKHEEKSERLYQHQFIPAIKKTEQTNGYARTHQYIPVGRHVAPEPTHHTEHHYVPQASPRKQTLITEKVSSHVQLGGSRKSTIHSEHHHHHHHHHHEKHEDVPSRPSSVASTIKHQPHSRTSTVSTVKATPVQRVQPTIQPTHNIYGDHQSVRVVKNVREYVTVFGATHKTPPPTPLAGIPRLSNNSARSPICEDTYHPVQSSRKSSVASVGNGVQINGGSRKSSVASCQSSRKSTVSNHHESPIVGGNVVVPRSRQSTITKDNVHEHYDELIRVSEMRRLFENYGPAHLPEYASSPYAYIH